MDSRFTTTGAGRLSVHVLATTVVGTRCALASAKRLTDGLNARVVLLVPRRHSFSLPFEPAGDEQTRLIDQHRALAASVGVHVTVLFCACHEYDDVVHQMLGRSALVIIGGRTRIWWPSREQRLVSRLTAQGYPVVFAQLGTEDAIARVPAEPFGRRRSHACIGNGGTGTGNVRGDARLRDVV